MVGDGKRSEDSGGDVVGEPWNEETNFGRHSLRKEFLSSGFLHVCVGDVW